MGYTHSVRFRLIPVSWRPVVVRGVLLAAVIFVASRIVAPVTLDLGESALQIRAVPRIPGGRSTVPLGPLGTVSFRTHTSPVDFEANLLIDPKAASLPDADDIDVRSWRREFALQKGGWLLAFGVLSGVLVTAGSRRRIIVAAAAGGVGAIVAGGAIGFAAVATFDLDALDRPVYRGPVRDVPRIVQLAREIGRDFPGTRRNIARAVEGLSRLRADLLAGKTARPAGETIRLLFIADLQSNPIGLLIADRLAGEFDVAAIIDAGDVTERGTALEGEIFASFSSIDVPYVVVPGNHEDDAAIARLQQIPNVVVLTDRDDNTTVAGVTIVGAEDPNARSIDVDPDNQIARTKKPVLCAHLIDRVAQTKAHILLVHDKAIGECAANAAQSTATPLLFAWGHAHRPGFEQRGSVISVSPGTSGAGGVKTDRGSPYGFAILELDADTKVATSVCLFAFEAPGELARADCRLIGEPDEP